MAATESSVWHSIARDVKALVDEKQCHPILVRLAWHDAGTYDVASNTGGPRAAMRFTAGESTHAANAGLAIARNLVQPIKDKYPHVGYADFWQFASYVAIEAAGGPHIPFAYGRKDATPEDAEIPSGRLPDASKGADHLRWIFTTKMGLDDQEIVALSGAHALGRGHKDRSGYEGPWTTKPNEFSNDFFVLLFSKTWVEKKDFKPLQYEDEETRTLMMLPTDLLLTTDPGFKPHAQLYARDKEAFFSDFSKAFKKLSELGASDLHPITWSTD